jgi:hypothetical protein
MTMTLIETKTLGTAAASIEFTSIPQDATDLVILGTTRAGNAGANTGTLRFNGDTGSNYSSRMLYSQDTATPTSAATTTTRMQWFYPTFSDSTTNTFSNFQLYITNYTASTGKSVSMDHTTEHNGTTPMVQGITAGLWTGTAAITSLLIGVGDGDYVSGSTISLYKITKGSSGGVVVS